jgi:hypothetical protein
MYIFIVLGTPKRGEKIFFVTFTTEYRIQNTEYRIQKLMYIKLPMYRNCFLYGLRLNDFDVVKSITWAIGRGGP